MNFETYIAARHLTRRRRAGFISLISFISVGGVAVGVMALIVVLAVMSGFDRELKNKIVNVQPHLRIEQIGGLQDTQHVISMLRGEIGKDLVTAAPFVEGQAIIRSEKGATGVVVKGLDPEHEDLSIYLQHLKAGAFDLAELEGEKKKEDPQAGIVIGEVLASILNVYVGDFVSLVTPYHDKDRLFFKTRAESRSFVVQGIYRVGMNDFDSSLALIHVEQAQKLYHLENRVTGVGARFRDVDEANDWKFALRRFFTADFVMRSWYDMNRNFFQALKVEKAVMTILLTLIILVAAFNIVSTLIMVVMEKTRDIGIMRSLGATPGSIRNIFILQGFIVGLMGVAVGAASGLWLAYNLNPVSDFLKNNFGIEVFPSDIYYFDKIPAEVHSGDVLWTVGLALLISVLAGFYPAARAASLKPVEALRYE